MTKIEIIFNGERLYGLSEVLAYLDKQRECISKFEKENAELREELNYAETHCLFRSDCPTQKENAELKEQLLEQKQYTAFKCNEAVKKKEMYEREHYLLTTAKEIIKKLINVCCSYGATGIVTAEAEQFLNSEVEK